MKHKKIMKTIKNKDYNNKKVVIVHNTIVCKCSKKFKTKNGFYKHDKKHHDGKYYAKYKKVHKGRPLTGIN